MVIAQIDMLKIYQRLIFKVRTMEEIGPAIAIVFAVAAWAYILVLRNQCKSIHATKKTEKER